MPGHENNRANHKFRLFTRFSKFRWSNIISNTCWWLFKMPDEIPRNLVAQRELRSPCTCRGYPLSHTKILAAVWPLPGLLGQFKKMTINTTYWVLDLYSLRSNMSYRKISWRYKVVRSEPRILSLFWKSDRPLGNTAIEILQSNINIPDSKVHRAHLGPVGPRWAPCWPHEPCYQGLYFSLASSNTLEVLR